MNVITLSNDQEIFLGAVLAPTDQSSPTLLVLAGRKEFLL